VTGVGKKQPLDLSTRRRATAAYFPVEEQGRRAGGRAGAGGRPPAPGVEGDRDSGWSARAAVEKGMGIG
jgi:hypothetical protein